MGESLDLEPIKARCAAATPGWWRANRDTLLMGGGDGPVVPMDGWPRGDREFVQYARGDVPSLVTEVEGLRTEVERLQTELEHLWQAHETACARIDALGQANATLQADKVGLRAALAVIRDYKEMSWTTFDLHHPGVIRAGESGRRFNIFAYAAAALANGDNGTALSLPSLVDLGEVPAIPLADAIVGPIPADA